MSPLEYCKGCGTWQHMTKKGCPRCGRRRIEDLKEMLEGEQ